MEVFSPVEAFSPFRRTGLRLGSHDFLRQAPKDPEFWSDVFRMFSQSPCTWRSGVSPYNKTSDVFSPEYKANTSRRIDFSADVITNTSSNIRLYTAFAMHIVEICPNITQFTVLTY